MSTLYYISDRGDFWDAETIASRTDYGVDYAGTVVLTDKSALATHLHRSSSKRVLFLIHGYNNDEASVMRSYKAIQDGLQQAAKPAQLYDLIIGYAWPGSLQQDSKLAYELAKKNVEVLAPRLRKHLEELSAIAKTIDVMAHSMGNRLLLTALQKPAARPLVNNFYSLAPAVDNESIDRGGFFFSFTCNCTRLYVFYSERDNVLKWAYALGEQDYALGYDGADKWKSLPKNVELVDCTEIVDGHSAYMKVPAIYAFIHNIGYKGILSAKGVEILQNGRIKVIKREPRSYETALKAGSVFISYSASIFSYSQGYVKTALCIFGLGSFLVYQYSRRRG